MASLLARFRDNEKTAQNNPLDTLRNAARGAKNLYDNVRSMPGSPFRRPDMPTSPGRSPEMHRIAPANPFGALKRPF